MSKQFNPEHFEPHESPEKRLELLQDNCDKFEEFTYLKKFTSDEIEEIKTKMVEENIRLSVLEQEKKEIMNEINEKIKPTKEKLKKFIEEVKMSGEIVEERCFVIYFHDEDIAVYYNDRGEPVFHRKLYPSEKQKTIMSLHRNDTRKNGTFDSEDNF